MAQGCCGGDAAHHSHSPEAEVNVLLKEGVTEKRALGNEEPGQSLPGVIPMLCDISFAWQHQGITRHRMHLRQCFISGGLVSVN